MMQGRQSFSETDGQHGGKVRVYEIAKEVGLPNKTLVAKVRGLGIDVKNHMSSIDLDDVQRVKRALEKERVENRETKRISATVIRRRSKGAVSSPAGNGERSDAAVVSGAEPSSVAPQGASQGGAVISPPLGEQTSARETKDRALGDLTGAARTTERTVEAVTDVGESVAAPATSDGATSDGATSDGATSDGATRDGATSDGAGETRSASAGPEGVAARAAVEARPPTGEAPEQHEPGPPKASGSETQSDEANVVSAAKESAVKERTPPKPPTPKREIRFAPGFGPNAKPPASRRTPQAASDAEPISAAEAAKMMLAPQRPARPKVVITDLDSRRREVGRKDLFQDRRKVAGRGRKKRMATGKKGKKTEITMPAEHKRVIRVEDTISVTEIARQLGVKSTELLKTLWGMGLANVTINQSLDADTAGLLAGEFGYEVEDVAFREEQVLKTVEDRPEDLKARLPVVTVMGHVDHGKTSLLDAIRGADVASREAGGITQHVGAYRVDTGKGELVFLDTPGHEAFTAMRARGAQCTDIVVLVVAADDGVMPQTAEAIDHARDAGVPIVVAVNKIDRPQANSERVKTQLSERNLVPEDWGGETLYVEVSAITKQGIDDLLETLVLQSELLELTANPERAAVGTVVEARMDRARGPMCSVLVTEGTLRVGDTVVAGEHIGKVRALLDDRGASVASAGPSTPVEVLGLGGVPEAGDSLNAIEDERSARQLAEFRHNQVRRKELGAASAKTTYEEILGQIQSGDVRELKLLLKVDVQGSGEAVREALLKLGTEKVSVNPISVGVGGIHETDVNLAKAAGAVIVGFNVRPAGKASQLAEREGVEIRVYDVIYELLDDVKSLMRGLLPKEQAEREMGRLEVRQTFSIPKIGTVAGCSVLEGRVTRNSHVRVIRDSVKIYDGRISSLKRFKDDVREVAQGYECGLTLQGYNDIKDGDILETYEIEEVTPELR